MVPHMNAPNQDTSPGTCGADVCHLNLHKTFVFLMEEEDLEWDRFVLMINKKITSSRYYNKQTKDYNNIDSIGMITSSNYSYASLLVIPYLYFKNMGSEGIKESTFVVILNANCLKKLEDTKILYNK